MRAIRFHRFGDPSVLQLDSLETPQPKGDEVLLRVHGSSINYSDLGLRRGELKMVSFWRMPLTPGFDVAGEVVACGPEVTAFLPGDGVYALLGLQAGGLAEYVCVAQEKLGKAPQTLSLVEAAAVPLAGLTALQGLRGKAGLHNRAGQRVLINGASGGVGAFAVQLAKFFKCHVTGVAGAGKRDFVRELGADEALDYHEVDFTKLSAQWDVVFDAAGKREFGEVRPVLRPGGVMVSTRTSPQGVLASVTTAVTDGPGFSFLITKERGQDLDFLAGLIDRGQLRVPIDRIFALTEAAEAHRYAEGKAAQGKVVIAVAEA
jgi:NADPH:quinone reductase-like Zn-dependent oxidoreductase